MTVKERLIEFLKFVNISQADFAQAVGLSNGFVNNIRVSIQPKTLHKIAMQYPNLNTAWLLTGEGDMLKTVKNDNYHTTDEVIKLINLLPISAYAGTLTDFVMSLQSYDCERIISPIKDAELAITIAGDSMAPEYPNGSQILIKKVDESAFLEYGKVYVLDTCNGVVVKILNKGSDPDHVRCTSINPDQTRYEPFEIPITAIYGYYRVLFVMAIK